MCLVTVCLIDAQGRTTLFRTPPRLPEERSFERRLGRYRSGSSQRRRLPGGTLFRTPPPAARKPIAPRHRVPRRRVPHRRPGSHNALVSAALGRLSTRQLPRRTGSLNALADAAQPLTPIGTHSGILSSSAPLRLLRPLRCTAAALHGGRSSRNWDPSPTGSVATATARARQRGQRPTAWREARRPAALSILSRLCGLRFDSILHLASHASSQSTTTS